MIGAIAGDLIGSVYEHSPSGGTKFPLWSPHSRFTDDTVLLVATASAMLRGSSYRDAYHEFGNRYPDAGYGRVFRHWLRNPDPQPYNSFGNGSAMRVVPVGFAFNDTESVLREAKRTAEPTHNHPEGIKGAQATALAIFLARSGAPREDIRSELSSRFGYDLTRSVEQVRPAYRFDSSCQGSVPESIIAFLDSSGLEDAIRLAISLGGDADTQACIAGGIAHAFYGQVPRDIEEGVRRRLPAGFIEVIDEFSSRYSGPASHDD